MIVCPLMVVLAILVKVKMTARRETDAFTGVVAAVEDPIRYNDGSTSLTTGAMIYPDKVRLNRRTKQDQSQACLSYGLQGGGKPKVNLYYYNHYSFWTDIKMIFATVLGKKIVYAGEVI